MRYRGTGLRSTGWALAILGVGSTIALNVARALLARGNAGAFNWDVGWANILSAVTGAAGLIGVMAGKLAALSDLSPARMDALADDLAREALRQDGELRARLLSTDVPDSRPAGAHFRIGKSGQATKPGAAGSRSPVRDFARIVDYFTNEADRRLVILGAPGAGKTVLAVTLTVGLLEQRENATADQRHNLPVPCLFYLPSWSPDGARLEDWLEAQLASRFRVGRKAAERLVRDGKVLPVLDGLDEMDSQEASSARSQTAVARINEHIAKTPRCQIVVICRSGVKHYERLARRVADAREVTVQSLTPAQMTSYIKLQNPGEPDLAAWKPVLDALHNGGSGGGAIRAELNSPWRLVAAVVYGREHDPATLLPTREETTRAPARAGYPARVSGLLMKAVLDARIAASGERGRPASAIRRLHMLAALLAAMETSREEGAEIVLHDWWKAFPERRVNRVQGMGTYAITNLAFNALWFLPFPSPHEDLTWYLGVMANYMLIQIYCILMMRNRKGPTAFRLAAMRSPRSILIAASGVVAAGLMGWAGAVLFGPLEGSGLGASFAAVMLLGSATTGLDIADASRPAATLANDRNLAVATGFTLASFITLAYGIIYGFTAGIMLASMAFIGAILSSSYGRYLFSVYIGTSYKLPLRLSGFLEWCHSAGILRLSGAGYQFRHRELLDYLVGLPARES